MSLGNKESLKARGYYLVNFFLTGLQILWNIVFKKLIFFVVH